MLKDRRRSIILLAAPLAVAALLLAGCTASPPTGVTATAGDGWARVTFGSGDPAFVHEVRSNPGDVSVNTSEDRVDIHGLQNGIAYTFSVRSKGLDGLWSDWSAPSAPVTPTGPPSAPTITGVTGFVDLMTGCTARVAVEPGSDGGVPITEYEVTVSGGSAPVRGTTSPIEVTGLTQHTTYDFTVRAINERGTSPSSATFTGVCS